jgi:DNA-binding MarR family transcriptional regulator
VPHDVAPQGVVPQELSPTAVSDRYIESHHQLKRVVDEIMQAAGLSLPRTKVLNQLLQEGPMRQQAIATCFGFAPRSITDMVDGLERDGLAERTDDPHDRRAKLVRITPAGVQAVGAAMAARAEVIHHVFGGLSSADRAELVRLIGLLDHAVLTLPLPSSTRP